MKKVTMIRKLHGQGGVIANQDYLKFNSVGGAATISLVAVGDVAPINLEYSEDKETWIAYTIGSNIVIPSGESVYLRAQSTNVTICESFNNHYEFRTISGRFNVSGDILFLLSRIRAIKTPPRGCFTLLFNECTGLVGFEKFPDDIVVSEYMCNRMFFSCTSLVTPPVLPARTLAVGCYQGMFNGCTSLTTMPQLPALVVPENGYRWMFGGCTALTQVVDLPATTVYDYGYRIMFQNCNRIQRVGNIAATMAGVEAMESMFAGCTALATIPSLNVVTLSNLSLFEMFVGCSSLVNAPHLPATTLATGCYNNIFNGCTRLNSISVQFTSWLSGATDNWVSGVSNIGTFTCPASLPDERGASRIPTNWTKVDL